MRTIVINTIGKAFTRKNVYFMAFAPEQIIWLNAPLDQLRSCVQLIQQMSEQQTVKQDYHLVVLFETDGFADSEYSDHRERLHKLLRTWFIEELLRPLDACAMTPLSAVELFLNRWDKDNATAPIQTYCETFNLDARNLPERVLLPYQSTDGNELALDFTPILGDVLSTFPQQGSRTVQTEPVQEKTDRLLPTTEMENAFDPDNVRFRLEESDDLKEEIAQNRAVRHQTSLESKIESRIQDSQDFRLLQQAKTTMSIQKLVFQAKIPDQMAVNADLQINLARLIHTLSGEEPADLSVVHWHDTKELARLISNAEATIQEQLDPAEPQMVYCELIEDLYGSDQATAIEHEICKRLRSEAGQVPGLLDALNEFEQGIVAGTTDEDLSPVDISLLEQLHHEFRRGLLRLSQERRAFQQRYRQLQEEYDREAVLENQRKVYDICANGYTAWRTNIRRCKLQRDRKPTLDKRPTLEKETYRELLAAKERCADGVLSQLEDFADVRQEAAEMRDEFNGLTRLWTPNMQKSSTKYFYRFSAVMGIIFIFLMVLPFLLISGQASDLKISRFVAYLISIGTFLALYIIGFWIWLRKLAKDIRALRGKLEQLIVQSGKARRESILRAVTTYTKVLPECLLQQLNYSVMLETDAENEIASQKVEQHIHFMKDALKEISDIRTALRVQVRPGEGESAHTRVDLLRAPYDATNQNSYMLFAERRGMAGDNP